MRGLAAYQAKIAALLDAYPDLRLELIDSATVPGEADGEELVYLHYVGRATGPRGRSDSGPGPRAQPQRIVVENVIRYDPAGCPAGERDQSGARNACRAAA